MNFSEAPSGLPPEAPPAAAVQVVLPDTAPVVTYSILGVTVLVFLTQLGIRLWLGFDLIAALGMKINAAIRAGEYWRLFTPMLLHASLMHIAFNMYALYVLGRDVERFYGHRRFLWLYLVSGFAGNVLSFLMSPHPSVGASTALFGLISAEGVLLYHNRDVFGPRARAALNQVITLAAINLLIGLSPGIDNWGHLGGLVGGLLFAWFAGPQYRLSGVPPVLHLEDQREALVDWQVGPALLALFAALVLLGMLK